MQNNSFFKFFVGFVAIIAVAFGVLIFASYQTDAEVDTPSWSM